MKCNACGEETRVNWGNATIDLCEKCSANYDPATNQITRNAKIDFFSLTESDEIFILKETNHDGPYSPSQAFQMWKNGQIRMDHKVWHASVEDWIPASEVFSKDVFDRTSRKASELQRIGYVILTGGLIITLYYLLMFDTSVATNMSSSLIPERVNNIDLLQTRQNGVIVGVALSIVGSMFVGFGHLRKQ